MWAFPCTGLPETAAWKEGAVTGLTDQVQFMMFLVTNVRLAEP